MDKDAICRLLPHAGAMCLLDEIVAWDADSIHCRAHSHLAADNPLRDTRGLHALAALEYGSQGMAAHGALLGTGGPAPAGYLAGVRDLQLSVARLDQIAHPLEIRATRLLSDTLSSIYDLQVQAGEHDVLRARATVMLQAETQR